MDNIKKFEDFLGKMQGLLDNAKKQGHIIIRVEDLENTFPELKESEDEKIRKAIHIYLDWLDGRKDYQPKGDYTIKDMLAWLEKQDPKKHEEELEKAYKTADKVQYRRGYEAAMKEMEKQGETYTKRDVDDAWLKGMCDAKRELDKQSEQKPAEKVEPKFHEGEWITIKE